MDYKLVFMLMNLKLVENVVRGNEVDYIYGGGTRGNVPVWGYILIVVGAIVVGIIGCCCRWYIRYEREERLKQHLSEVVSKAVSQSYNRGVTDGQRTHIPPVYSRQDPLNPKTRGTEAARGPPPDYGSTQSPIIITYRQSDYSR